ncbi:hypothetical protein M413DRAFT_447110 [Hebeloma cylindrosporum]|uniref:Uncharacterized protein n=1 Tax=Hebeloma cylindrosporum TaxID=76867 RepID=A0A0C3C7V8_HEBCY|nr:hypothetical protein M413DRAFT_447110 [Hebeloma cylindrosporum h7]
MSYFQDVQSYKPAFQIYPIPGFRVCLVHQGVMYVGKVVHSETTFNSGELMTLEFANDKKQKWYRTRLLKPASQDIALTDAPGTRANPINGSQ